MRQLKPVEFHRTKYGSELLIDVAWVHEMPTFITNAPHVLNFWDIMLVTRGRGVFSLDGEPHPIRRGAVFFTAPGQIRDWSVESLDGVCLFFPASFLDDFFADPSFLESLPYFARGAAGRAMYLGPRTSARLRRRLTVMRRELRSPGRDSVHLLRARLYEILIELARLYSARRGPSPPAARSRVIAQYRALIEMHARHHHDVAFYAARLGITTGHLNSVCRRFVGKTAKALVTDELSLRARRLLLYSDQTAAEISSALGFVDPSYFTRFVRRTSGKTPSALRSTARNGDGS